MPRNITRGELNMPTVTDKQIAEHKKKAFNPMGNPDPNYGKSKNPIIAHYEFADKRLIVKKEPSPSRCDQDSYYLYIETKSKDSLGNEVWLPYLKTQIPEPEDIYDLRGLGSTNNINEAFSTLVAILLYKRQDLLVDKMEAKPNA